MANLTYFIGVDHREPDALRVAMNSANYHAEKAGNSVDIKLLEHIDLRRKGWFHRPWRIDEAGQYWDEQDGRPFSVQFSHSRFLTPLIAKSMGCEGWALFTDCDWLWLADPTDILKEADPSKVVQVVKHNYQVDGPKKMDGMIQSAYSKKLWSACALWNLSSDRLPTFEMVNAANGSFLHGFEWLTDQEIGDLSESWHYVPNASPTTLRAQQNPIPINAVHFTLGTPEANMTDRKPTIFDKEWLNERTEAYRNAY